MSKFQKTVHVLVVEDNEDDVFLFKCMIACSDHFGFNFKFSYVARLDESIQFIQSHVVDIVVLDLSLPDSRGIQTLDQFLAQSQGVPVVVLTSLNDSDRALEVVSRGAQDYLVKGEINPHVFERTLLHGIERHRIRHEYQNLAEELKATNNRLEKLILLDPLTGLLNRRGLQEALSRELDRCSRGESDLLALILDLDNFKTINDTLGHAVGDVTLREISQKIVNTVRITDVVARIGGDEFMILMPQTRFAEGMIVAGKIRRAISSSPVPLSFESKFSVTASLGLVSVNPEIMTVEELLSKMHNVLHYSKKNGKNRISFEDGTSGSNEDSSLFTSVLNALKNGREYHVVKQPIYHLNDSKMVGYEFLSRFSMKGLEVPDDFFRVCQENNILSMVDRQCFKNCVTAGSLLPKNLLMHINLFPSTIMDMSILSLMQTISPMMELTNFCVEISEQQIIGDPSYLVQPIRSLRQMGAQIAIDDVGFGRSCLESLILLEPDIVKIDKKWVNGIHCNPIFEKSLRKLVKITQAIGSELVAEGIETKEDMEMLQTIGVPYGQGYYLGRPE